VTTKTIAKRGSRKRTVRKKDARRITEKAIDPLQFLAQVKDGKKGATVLFLGTVRDNSEAGDVDRILYEAYVPMAERRMLEIEEEVRRAWPVIGIKLEHRIGVLKVGEISVAVAVSSPHRGEAFDACRHAIERIKRDVPIWKKEKLADGKEVWVEGRRMRQTVRPRRTGRSRPS
jgi:molybdopterin synthase catalytic subunit